MGTQGHEFSCMQFSIYFMQTNMPKVYTRERQVEPPTQDKTR